uniref:SAWADEE domain-containing protein n=1 Tax=Arundo donax TaxID=35708 RepID=A0A0A9DW25_ARUDO
MGLIACAMHHCVLGGFWIAKMEKLAADRKERVLDGNFCQKLAGEFNRSAVRAGCRALQDTQVQEWFLNKFPASTTKSTCLPTASQEKVLASEANVSVSEEKAATSEEKLLALETSISNNVDEVSPDFPIEIRDKVPELEELEFEAKSAKDSAWYDIAIFLAHRRNKSGEVVRTTDLLSYMQIYLFSTWYF